VAKRAKRYWKLERQKDEGALREFAKCMQTSSLETCLTTQTFRGISLGFVEAYLTSKHPSISDGWHFPELQWVKGEL